MAASRLVLVAEDSGHVLGRDAVEMKMKPARWFVLERGG
jgi:hypothetical protein